MPDLPPEILRMAEVAGRDAAITAYKAERDRYREALERIANEDYRGPEPSGRRIARDALEGGDDA